MGRSENSNKLQAPIPSQPLMTFSGKRSTEAVIDVLKLYVKLPRNEGVDEADCVFTALSPK